jgi:phosphopantothenoylcysteine decarboxylase/phosphopantothenate--cysteine ligase
MKKKNESLTLQLEPTKDILSDLGRMKKNQFIVGFAAETHDVENYAKQKLEKKQVDMIVANDVSKEGVGFHVDTNAVTIYSSTGKKTEIGLAPKKEIALAVLNTIMHERGH